MARKKSLKYKPKEQRVADKTAAPKSQFLPQNQEAKISKMLLLIGILLTLGIYIPSLNNGWITNWDDGGYIHKYEPVQSINTENLKEIFTTFYKGNYHPLTTVFYAIEYQIAELNPFLYHLNNLILHLINVWLVFLLIWRLFKRNEWAFFTALLFGIHTMHVESVAWISERKDVLYTMFYLLALLSYIFYLDKQENKKNNYILAVVFMLLSLLSKSAAVALPITLLVVDYLKKRKIDKVFIFDKAPFFLLSLIFGIVAIKSQGSAGAIQDLAPMFTWLERGLLASYGLCLYFLKLFIPTGLSAMHPYPMRVNDMLPLMYYVAPFIVASIAALVFWSTRKNRIIAFGIFFFLANIILVLQILPVGAAIIAERYTYIPYIGLFLIMAYGITYVIDTFPKWRIVVMVVISAWTIWVSYLTVERIGVWKRGDILFLDVIEKYPMMPFAYNNLGFYYYEDMKNNKNALFYFTKCLSIDATFHQAYSNRGILYFNAPIDELRTITGDTSANLHLKRFSWAIDDFTKAIQLKASNRDALIGRANAYSEVGMFNEAISDYDAYIELKPEDVSAWKWRGTAKYRIKKFEEAEVDFNNALQLDPKDAEAHYWIGLIRFQNSQFEEALKLFDLSIGYDPNKAEVYSWRGLAKYNLNNYHAAIADYNKALELNPNDLAALVNRSVCKNEIGDFESAFSDIEKARAMGYPVNPHYYHNLFLKTKQAEASR